MEMIFMNYFMYHLIKDILLGMRDLVLLEYLCCMLPNHCQLLYRR